MKLKSCGITTQVLDNELIINDSDTDQVHILNETAAIIWEELELMRSTDQIEEKLKKLYRMNEVENEVEDVKKQILETLESFRKKGLL